MVGLNSLLVRKNGYLYVYVSNESNQNVYFDALIVNHKRGPVVEETAYYPFGLAIDGLSSKANKPASYDANKFKFNGMELQAPEFADNSGLNWTDFGARMYDPQIGRWLAHDPMAEKFVYESTYAFAGNNPCSNIDVDGAFKFPIIKESEMRSKYKHFYNFIKYNMEDLVKSPRVMAAYKSFSMQKPDDLKKDFKGGQGTEIVLKENTEFRAHYNPKTRQIEIRKDLIDLIESTDGQDREAVLAYVALEIMHEQVHKGNNLSIQRRGNVFTDEDGYALGEQLYITNVDINSDYSNFSFLDKNWKENVINTGRKIIAEKKKRGEQDDLPKINKLNTSDAMKKLLTDYVSGGGKIQEQ